MYERPSQDRQNAAYDSLCGAQGRRCFPRDCKRPASVNTQWSREEYGAVLLAAAFQHLDDRQSA